VKSAKLLPFSRSSQGSQVVVSVPFGAQFYRACPAPVTVTHVPGQTVTFVAGPNHFRRRAVAVSFRSPGGDRL
jgi:hypothetical protein